MQVLLFERKEYIDNQLHLTFFMAISFGHSVGSETARVEVYGACLEMTASAQHWLYALAVVVYVGGLCIYF